jgi:hypothetical protein
MEQDGIPQHACKRPKSRQEGDEDEEMSVAEDMEELAELAAAMQGEEAKEVVLTNEHLLATIFGYLCLEDLCRCAMVRARWRAVTSNPEFWSEINLKGRTVQVSKVRHLLSQHSGVKVLNARGVAFAPSDLTFLLPKLTKLESLEMDKGGYERLELEALATSLPCLTRLVLAGGLVGSHLPDWSVLAHPRLEALVLESGRTTRLRIHAPQLTSLSLRDFQAGAFQLQEANALSSLSVHDCNKLTDTALRTLLSLEGAAATGLAALTSITFSGVPTVSDETLRLVGQRHSAMAVLSLSSCAAVTGSGLGQHGAFPALRSLLLDSCDSVTG